VTSPVVGVLALQGAFVKHCETLRSLGIDAPEVRLESHLDAVDALVIPGGESTTMSKMLDLNDLREPLAKRLTGGMGVLGTCAGMILLARDVLDGRSDQKSFGAIDIAVRRNGYGRQVDSFEADLDIDRSDDPFRAVFIRAPKVESAGPKVEVLARVGETPVLCRQGPITVASFHPELTADNRIHQGFLNSIGV
jgi:5'-phosphate synthase pdxT subunit